MKIELFYFADCPNYRPALERLRKVLAQEGLSPEISTIEIDEAAAARELRCIGSPTIRIEGLDVDFGCRSLTETGWACRWYPGGAPSEDMIRSALREALER